MTNIIGLTPNQERLVVLALNTLIETDFVSVTKEERMEVEKIRDAYFEKSEAKPK